MKDVSNKSLFAIVCLAAMLAGCGGGSSGTTSGISLPIASSDSGSGSSVSLKNFTVTGTGPVTQGETPIDANINGGAFRVDWETTGSGSYRIDLYVSADGKLDEADDIRFFGQNCQEGLPLMKCGLTGGFDCQFTTENKISCGTDALANPPKDLSAFLTALPQSAYIILGFRDSSGILSGKLETIAVPVVFQ